jgi:hypothetical protein
MLKVDWFITPPLDFEHKNYLLLDFLSKMDQSFSIHKLSPYLLWSERLVDEIRAFESSYKNLRGSMKREIKGFSWSDGIIYTELQTPKELEEVLEIIDYSIPLLESRIQLGYKLWKRFPQLLYLENTQIP